GRLLLLGDRIRRLQRGRATVLGEAGVYHDLDVGTDGRIVAGGCHEVSCEFCDYGVVRALPADATAMVEIARHATRVLRVALCPAGVRVASGDAAGDVRVTRFDAPPSRERFPALRRCRRGG